MKQSPYSDLVKPRVLLLLPLACIIFLLPVALAAFGTDPLLFVSERGDVHIGVTRAHSNFIKVIQGDKYVYGMRTELEDQIISSDDFYKKIDDRRKEFDKAPIILFVHGCCVSFGEQLLQANDLQKAIDTSYARSPVGTLGHPITISYDWAAPFSYSSSLENCITAQNRFDSFMGRLVSRYGAANIVIVAHSLGTLMVQNYTSHIKVEDNVAPFQAIIFSRADVDRQSFSDCLPALKAYSNRLMVLSSHNDPNIYASSLLRKLGVKFAQAAVLPTRLPLPRKKNSNPTTSTVVLAAADNQPESAKSSPVERDTELNSHPHLTRRLGQVKVAREFASSVEVYDMSSLRIGHGIPYKFIGGLVSNNTENFELKKDVTGLVTVHSAKP